jgi:hypothetical protein
MSGRPAGPCCFSPAQPPCCTSARSLKKTFEEEEAVSIWSVVLCGRLRGDSFDFGNLNSHENTPVWRACSMGGGANTLAVIGS